MSACDHLDHARHFILQAHPWVIPSKWVLPWQSSTPASMLLGCTSIRRCWSCLPPRAAVDTLSRQQALWACSAPCIGEGFGMPCLELLLAVRQFALTVCDWPDRLYLCGAGCTATQRWAFST